jgi:TonB family protein
MPQLNFTLPDGERVCLNPRDWVIPTGEDFARFYPKAALRDGRSARLILDCRVTESGRLDDCKATEEPASTNQGFEAATVALGARFTVQTKTADGRRTVGGRVTFPVRWMSSQDD